MNRLLAGGTPHVRPLAFGYLRLWAANPPDVQARHTAEIEAFAEQAGRTLAAVYTDPLDPAEGQPDRTGFCALTDALRRHLGAAVIIRTTDDLSRHPASYRTRVRILEREAGGRLLVMDPTGSRR